MCSLVIFDLYINPISCHRIYFTIDCISINLKKKHEKYSISSIQREINPIDDLAV